ncbi:purine-nucleoside phosphorylase [Sporanaerobium hydrogeniformans]|uniref:Purine-nucleoside phosphorylase n=1 Tax=Sporanaerobium hydrogeniformans TaxID=3072179 RepID=A0AC61DFI0_9FIRM|nr:DUF523 domain-containing protein [Sporanaerobium hydrogeniformans]PHV71252.1 purine-nucleoside phosphorylase [Sporanaerobium hydrogeniformans]
MTIKGSNQVRSKEKQALLVSACLLGINCKYSGGNNFKEEILNLKGKYHLIPVCPEQLGGLTTPRNPVELRGEERSAWTSCGVEVTTAFIKGAEETLKLAQLFGCKVALLKENSPSCGFGTIYDGSFSGQKKEGMGITAELLHQNGIFILGENQLSVLEEQINE